jgi:hypothetical protein
MHLARLAHAAQSCWAKRTLGQDFVPTVAQDAWQRLVVDLTAPSGSTNELFGLDRFLT